MFARTDTAGRRILHVIFKYLSSINLHDQRYNSHHMLQGSENFKFHRFFMNIFYTGLQILFGKSRKNYYDKAAKIGQYAKILT